MYNISLMVDFSNTQKQCERGEQAMKDLYVLHIQDACMSMHKLGRGVAWLGTGIPEILLKEFKFAQLNQKRTVHKNCYLKETTQIDDWISVG